MRSLFASFHQGSPSLFGNNAGFQCTAVALAAIVLASLQPANEWHSSDLNEIMYFGNSLFSSIIREHYNNVPLYLMPSDLPREVTYRSHAMQISYLIDCYHGVVNSNGDAQSNPFLAVSLEEGLRSVFSSHDFALLTFGELTVAMLHDRVYNTYHVYDSHSHDALGYVCPDGTAVLLSFSTFAELCMYLQSLYQNEVFNITPVEVSHYPPIVASFPTTHGFPVNCIEQGAVREAVLQKSSAFVCANHHDHTYSQVCDIATEIMEQPYEKGNVDTSCQNLQHFQSQIGVSTSSIDNSSCYNHTYSQMCDMATEVIEQPCENSNVDTSCQNLQHFQSQIGVSTSSINNTFCHNHTYSQMCDMATEIIEQPCENGNVDTSSENMCTNTTLTQVCGEGTSASEQGGTRVINDSLGLHTLSSLPDQFRTISTSQLSAEHVGANETCCLQERNVSEFQSTSTAKRTNGVTAGGLEERWSRDNLTKASAIQTSLAGQVFADFIKEICMIPDKSCASCKCFLFFKDTAHCDFTNEQTAF